MVQKHKGRQHCFGKLDDWQAALECFKRQWPVIAKGLPIPPDGSDTECTLQVLCNAFLNFKCHAMEADDLSARSFADDRRITDSLIGHFGTHQRIDALQPADFEKFRAKLAATLRPVSLKDKINRIRVVFKCAHDQRLIDSPVNYGQSFNRRRHSAKCGTRLGRDCWKHTCRGPFTNGQNLEKEPARWT